MKEKKEDDLKEGEKAGSKSSVNKHIDGKRVEENKWFKIKKNKTEKKE